MTRLEMTKLDEHPERHYYLYAKGWYKRKNIQEDLAKILRNYTGWEYEGIKHEFDCAVKKLVCLWEEHYKKGHFTTVLSLLSDIDPDSNFYNRMNSQEDKPYNFKEAIAYRVLSDLRLLDTDKIGINLGRPDKKILPWKRLYTEKELKEMEER